MNKIRETLSRVRAPESNTPLAVAAVLVAVILGGFGLIVDTTTVLNVLLVALPLVAGVFQWNTSKLTEPVEEDAEELVVADEEVPEAEAATEVVEVVAEEPAVEPVEAAEEVEAKAPTDAA